jgi:hypothetical protein
MTMSTPAEGAPGPSLLGTGDGSLGAGFCPGPYGRLNCRFRCAARKGPSGRRTLTISTSRHTPSSWRSCAPSIVTRGPQRTNFVRGGGSRCGEGWWKSRRSAASRTRTCPWGPRRKWSSVRHYRTGMRRIVEIESEWTARERGWQLPEWMRRGSSTPPPRSPKARDRGHPQLDRNRYEARTPISRRSSRQSHPPAVFGRYTFRAAVHPTTQRAVASAGRMSARRAKMALAAWRGEGNLALRLAV